MDKLTKVPTKEQVRSWLNNELARHRPPPDMEQIRRELGWGLVELARNCRRPQSRSVSYCKSSKQL